MDESINMGSEKLSYKEKVKFACVIAKPMASKSQSKKLYKLMKQASQDKTHIRIGLKEVQKAIRKEETGIVIIGADISPIDIIVHMPAVCEERDIPYCYTPLRSDIGHSIGLNRSVAIILIKQQPNYKELYDECVAEIEQMPCI